jgi:hypothetical protein
MMDFFKKKFFLWLTLASDEERIEVISKPLFESGVYDGPEFNCPAFSYLNPKIQCRKCEQGAG